jgi:hypothetical protein
MALIRSLVQALFLPRLVPKPSKSSNIKHKQSRPNAKKNGCGRSRRTNSNLGDNGCKHLHKHLHQNNKAFIAYHGTPSLENAKSIVRHGWMVGSGNASGDGIYLAKDLATAKSYAGITGIYLKCRISGKTCQWTTAMQAKYSAWCQARGVRQDNSAKTAFLIQQGFDVLQTGNVIVTLAPQMANPTAWKRRDHRIRVLAIYRASDDRRIRV